MIRVTKIKQKATFPATAGMMLILVAGLLIASFGIPKSSVKHHSGTRDFDQAEITLIDSLKRNTKYPLRAGPPVDLTWDYGPVSFGLIMDMEILPLSSRKSEDLLVSRIWSGLFLYPMKEFNEKELSLSPLQLAKTGVLMFRSGEWNKDRNPDLVGGNRDGFLYLLPAIGNFPGVSYQISDENLIRDAKSNLVFNIPFENPDLPAQDSLGGYTDIQYFNYLYPRIYENCSRKWKDLVIGDSGGNLWWLQDISYGEGKPAYSGITYSKKPSGNKSGKQYQEKFGLVYVKPSDKITDENGNPFYLGIGKEGSKSFKGAMTRPFPYHSENGQNMDLIVLAGIPGQQIYYLKRINDPNERKPLFRNLGEIRFDGLDVSSLNCHSKLCLIPASTKNDLLISVGNFIGILENIGWSNEIPRFALRGWISGQETRASGYVFTEIILDKNGSRYILDFANYYWKPVRILNTIKGIKLHYSGDSLKIMDQNGIFKVPGVTDPQFSPEWGYHRMSKWNFDGSGRQHLLAATDMGNLYLLTDDLKMKSSFVFRSAGPLKDTLGNVIKIHNRAIAAGFDLNNDNREDLIVGGISYQMGILSDPFPGGGIYYLLNLGLDSLGIPKLSPPLPLEIGQDFHPRMNSHILLQAPDLDHDGEKELVLCLQDPGWSGRIYSKIADKIGFSYTGYNLPMEAIVEQLIDIDGDGDYEIVRPGDESGVGNYRELVR